MKKITLPRLIVRCSCNVSFSEAQIISLIKNFENGKIAPAAARRAFPELWNALTIDIKRYNNLVSALVEYDANEGNKYGFIDCSKYGEYYNYFVY